jgi:hypothetical protein
MKYLSTLNLKICSQKFALNNIVKSNFFKVKYLTNMTTPKKIRIESTNGIEKYTLLFRLILLLFSNQIMNL